MRRLAASLIGVAFSLAMVAGPVAAAAPVRAVFTQVTDQVAGSCPDGGVVTAHFEFKIIRWIFPDRVEYQVNTDATWTESVTGRYLTNRSAFHTVTFLDPTSDSGSSGGMDRGNFGMIVIPGSGVVYHVAGRIVRDANGDPVIQVGVDTGAGVEVCQALGGGTP